MQKAALPPGVVRTQDGPNLHVLLAEDPGVREGGQAFPILWSSREKHRILALPTVSGLEEQVSDEPREQAQARLDPPGRRA